MIFEKNIEVLKTINPELTEAVTGIKKETDLKILTTRTGMPALRAGNITLHSRYDPVKEAEGWLRYYSEEIKSASTILVLGFGFGYHLIELCKATEKDIVVFEPRLDILRTALETVDLSSVLSRVKLVTDNKIPSSDKNFAILQHKPSVNLSNTYFEWLLSRLKSLQAVNNGLKILVVSPLYGGSLPIARYCASTLKKMGHNVELIDNSRYSDVLFSIKEITKDKTRYNQLVDIFSSFLSELVMARCGEFKPDLIFALAQAPLTVDCLKRLRQNKIPTAFWFVEDFRVMDYWRKNARFYDYFFTIQKGDFFNELKKIDIKNYHYLPLAAHPDTHKKIILSKEEIKNYGSDVSFVGAGYYNRRCFLKGLLDFDLKIWGSEWDRNSPLAKCIQRSGERIETEEAVKIFNAAKININLHSSTYHTGINPFGDFVNPRTFEILSCGGFQLVDRRSEIDELFRIGEEIVVFDSLDDLRHKITYYLNNPEERYRIAERARQRMLKGHTYENRMEEMLDFIIKSGYEPPGRGDEGEDVKMLIKEAGRETELGEFLSEFSDRGRITLSDITEEIKNGEGDISFTENLFLMMDEMLK